MDRQSATENNQWKNRWSSVTNYHPLTSSRIKQKIQRRVAQYRKTRFEVKQNTKVYCNSWDNIPSQEIQLNRAGINQNEIKHNTIQYNTIQYNTIQYNTIQYNTIQYNTASHNTTTIAKRCENKECIVYLYRLIYCMKDSYLRGKDTNKYSSEHLHFSRQHNVEVYDKLITQIVHSWHHIFPCNSMKRRDTYRHTYT